MASPMSMFVHQHPTTTHTAYRIPFFEHTIDTLLTNSATIVDSWISETQSLNFTRLHRLVIGLDVEWRPSFSTSENPIAIIQLCVGNRCLVFQIIHCPGNGIPRSLVNFLGNSNYTFTGVEIANDVEKLRRDYNVTVARTVDLRTLAADVYNMMELRNAGLQQLASTVLGKEISKERSVTLSRWDDERLTPSQVEYAAIDAFLSFEMARVLLNFWK